VIKGHIVQDKHAMLLRKERASSAQQGASITPAQQPANRFEKR